jgi:hypothetical protein
MGRRKAVFFFLLILSSAVFNSSCTEVQPQVKTVKLSGEAAVPDLRGVWKVDYEYYGIYRALTGYCNMVTMFQDENKFVAIVNASDQVVAMGTETIRGELSRNGFNAVQLFTKDRGWLDCEGVISANGNQIVLVEKTQKRTLTRKR